MKVEMELHPNFVSDLVVKQLQEMYEHTKEDYFYTDPEEAQAAIAVVLDYFMPPLEYEKWKADNVLDRNLAEEVVEGFDHLDKKRSREEFLEDLYKWAQKPYKWIGLTKEELQDLCVKSYTTDSAGETHFNRGYFADAIEAKLKEKNT